MARIYPKRKPNEKFVKGRPKKRIPLEIPLSMFGNRGTGKTYSTSSKMLPPFEKGGIEIPDPRKKNKANKKLKTVSLNKKLENKFGKKGIKKLKNDVIVIDNISKKLGKTNIMKAKKEKLKSVNKKDLTINTVEINKFLRTLNNTELGYLYHTVNLSNAMRNIISKYDLTKERFCKEMGIKKVQYNEYIRGSKNYSLMDMAKLNTLSDTLIKENLNKEAPVKFPK